MTTGQEDQIVKKALTAMKNFSSNANENEIDAKPRIFFSFRKLICSPLRFDASAKFVVGLACFGRRCKIVVVGYFVLIVVLFCWNSIVDLVSWVEVKQVLGIWDCCVSWAPKGIVSIQCNSARLVFWFALVTPVSCVYGVHISRPTPLHCDNKSAIQIAKNSLFHE
ncbi:hypothetical protein HAX54_018786 [Datura stramonium]|uniref:Uncharacterized protein n=1 Tax=Datura stramonium TaxID=4076 RepID=A0ABS8UN74_DATST|nr:hypothetical protein [Datura stramonium]